MLVVPAMGLGPLHAAFHTGYNVGDVIFYDLENRKRMGLEAAPSLMLSLQKAYNRFSHSGLYVPDPTKLDEPMLLHGLRIRLKRLSWQVHPRLIGTSCSSCFILRSSFHES